MTENAANDSSAPEDPRKALAVATVHKMKVSPNTAVEVLKAFIREDRNEVRIYRGRLHNMAYSLAVASFAITAFLIGTMEGLQVVQLRYITLITDIGLVAVLMAFFIHLAKDLYWLRKAMRARQDYLEQVDGERDFVEIEPFPTGKNTDPDIRDRDLYLVVCLATVVVLLKMLAVLFCTSLFIPVT